MLQKCYKYFRTFTKNKKSPCSEDKMKPNTMKKYGMWIAGGIAALILVAFIGTAVYRSNLREIKIDHTIVGYTKDEALATELFEKAKQVVNEENKNTIRWAVELSMEKGKGKRASSEEELQQAMEQVLEQLKDEQAQLSYVLKIEDYEVILESKKDVKEVLEKTQEKYSKTSDVQIALVSDEETSALVPEVNLITKSAKNQNLVAASKAKTNPTDNANSGESNSDAENNQVVKVAFAEEIEVGPVYVKKEQLTDVDEAVSDIIKEKDHNETYTVKQGDTISGIANENGMTVSEFMKINEQIEDENSIMPGDEVIVAVPKPELSVIVQKKETYKKKYYADTIYVKSSSMYKDESKVVRKGKAGVQEVTAVVSYKNGQSYRSKVTDKEVIKKAVAKKVIKGTKERPTYIKPIQGGTLTSQMGQRWGRMHEGIDWGCPIGTTVMASRAGTVIQAGWVNGYGNCITISHGDGVVTRYGHLDRIQASVGQTVSQGETIGCSGNTGRSTGPHLHFEIRINGTPVNALDYL